MSDLIRPSEIRLEASTACQLRCPSCPTTQGKIDRGIGTGFLRLEAFRRLVDANRWIRKVELSNWGEILLNPELVPILEAAHERRIAMHADNGVNLDRASPGALEGLVRFRLRSMKVSIDGASEPTYRLYRRGGSLERVLGNVQRINELKRLHRSEIPILKWQFVVFAHNEHELGLARVMAAELGMRFKVKLPWDDPGSPAEFRSVRDRARVARESGLGLASRRDVMRRTGLRYNRNLICSQLWRSPQVNWDGRVLGCCVNFWGDYGNAFDAPLLDVLNGERFVHARRMLRGLAPPRADVPCTSCHHYRAMAATGRWLRPEDIHGPGPVHRAIRHVLDRLGLGPPPAG